MKTTIFLCVFLFIGFYTVAQNQEIHLNLKQDYEYIFERSETHSLIKEDGTKLRDRENKVVFRLASENYIPDSIALVNLSFKECFYDETNEGGPIDKTDLFFPPFNSYSSRAFSTNYFIPELISLTFQFTIHLRTGGIALANRAQVLENFYSRLKEKGYTDKEIRSKIEYFNERELDRLKNEIEFLTWFLNTTVSTGDTIKNSKTDELFVVKEPKDGFVALGEDNFEEIQTGKTKKKYRINLDNGIITNYSTIKFDSIASRVYRNFNNYVLQSSETNFRLLYAQKIPAKKIFIQGKIENPLSDKIHIRYLDEPFGTTLKTNTVLLKEENNFQTTVDFPHPSFVYIENENNNKHNPPGTYVFYAEPGDTIIFSSTGSKFPWETVFSGSKPKASELLQSLRMNIKLPVETATTSRNNLIFDQLTIAASFRVVYDNAILSQFASATSLIPDCLEESEKFLRAHKSALSDRAYNFIENETRAYFYTALYGSALIDLQQYNLDSPGIIEQFKENRRELSKVDMLDLHKIYNDYGLHSRMCVESYVNYSFKKSNRIAERFSSFSANIDPSQIELKTQFSRMVLTGSPLYREIGKNYQDIILKSGVTSTFKQESIEKEAVDGLEKIVKLCNDNEIVDKARQLVNQTKKLVNEYYLPSLELFDINGLPVTYKKVVDGKPTIICFSTNWIGKRYDIDTEAQENADLKFVFVVEGSSIEQWQQYTERAVPVAEQLFYNNGKQSLQEVFHENEVFLIFNEDGEFMEYANGLRNAISIAKESLQPKKKELNKSQLQIVILVLLIILTTLIIGLVLWKWRVRQRFRKEEQKRKLRELELTAIRSQMNPHFLFNALNSVQNLVQQNKGREAHLYLSDFAGLIRKVLNNSEKEEVSLAEELEMIRQYLNLEKLRFDFDFKIEIDEQIDVHNTLVPSLLMQPFVENAVIHGLQSKTDNRQLKVRVSKEAAENTGSIIKITIEDNGIGRKAATAIAKRKNGKGTKLMKERLNILQQKQDEKYELKTTDLPEGTRVEIIIPEES